MKNQSAFKKIIMAKLKGFTTTTTAGRKIIIEDQDSDGNPSVGDLVTDEQTGDPIRNETLIFERGSVGGKQTEITTDQDGKITTVKSVQSVTARIKANSMKIKRAFQATQQQVRPNRVREYYNKLKNK